MTVSLFTFVDLYSRMLTAVGNLLDKGLAHATAKGVSEAEMLDWRLIEDMHPLTFQVATVLRFARQWPARAAGVEIPEEQGTASTVAEFKSQIADAKAYLAGFTAEQFAGRDDVPVTYAIGNGMEPTLPAGQWTSVFATTNLYFHASMAYAILRAHGVPIGKPDIFAGL